MKWLSKAPSVNSPYWMLGCAVLCLISEQTCFTHISSHVVSPIAIGVAWEWNLLDFLFCPRCDHYFNHIFCAWLDNFFSDCIRLLTLRNSIWHLVAGLKRRLFLYRKFEMRKRRFQVVSYSFGRQSIGISTRSIRSFDNLLFKFNVSLPLVTGELLQKNGRC